MTFRPDMMSKRDPTSIDGGERKAIQPRTAKLATLRYRECLKIALDRYGPELPDDDAGRDDALLLLAHLAAIGGDDAERRMDDFIELRCPWMSPAEAAKIKIAACSTWIAFTADEMAEKLNLTMHDRSRLGLRTIGAVDCDAAGRKALRLQRQRERQRQYRKERRERPKSKPSLEARAIAVWRVTTDEWRAVKQICRDLETAHEFLGLRSIRSAVHLAIAEAERRNMVRKKDEAGQGGMKVTLLMRAVR